MNGKEKLAAYCLLALHGYKRSEIEEIMKKMDLDKVRELLKDDVN
ncbi:hypothetical protein Goe24_01240 [Bacillus phage vB_BsuM-Goe24]|nr:hypothetical protein Goe7_c01240 [Bacillus phage vB_BveM-Goe7]WCS69499.1 hypothetical protein Goe24_01240 [Bacillus phage vB_BsuM-Goe24]